MAARPLWNQFRIFDRSAVANTAATPIAVVAASRLILLAGMGTIFACAYMMVATYSPLPFWDGWIEVMYGAQGGNPFTLDWLWSQYNEHRMPIPKLFLLADLHWFHATQSFLLISIFSIVLAQLLVFGWMLRKLGGWRGWLWRSGFGLAAFCLFSLAQWENLTWGMQVCFVFPGLLASLAFIGLLLYWKNRTQGRRWRYLSLSIASALGASWCYANGNLLWPLLVIAALALGLEWRAVLTYAVAGAVCIALYMYGYVRPASNLGFGSMAANVKYLAAYFGSSWVGNDQNHALAECIGMLGFGLLLFFALGVRSDLRENRLLRLELLLLMLFCLASGAATALGRSQLGIVQAFSSRYQTVALLYWCCLGLLILDSFAARELGRHFGVVALQLGFLLLMGFGAMNAGTPLIRARVRSFHLNAGAMSLVTDITDQDQLKWVYWGRRAMKEVNPYIRENRLSIYDKPIYGWLGQPLASTFRIASADRCSGKVESATAMEAAAFPALRVTGWAWDNQRREPPVAIVTASEGTITGLGAVGDFRPLQKSSRNWMSGNYVGYTAYSQNVSRSEPIAIYAIVKGRPATACLVGTAK